MYRFILLVLCVLCVLAVSGCASRRGVAELAADATYDGYRPTTCVTAKVYVTFSD